MSDGTQSIGAKLAEGAAEAAPTAPHATPAARRHKKTGPERFWDRRRVRFVFGSAIALSCALHYALSPFQLFVHGFTINDAEGEATLPIELLEDQEEPPPPEPAQAHEQAASESKDHDPNGEYAGDASVTKSGTILPDAGAPDGAALHLKEDAGALGEIPDAGPDAAKNDPVNLAAAIKSGDPLVVLVLNMDVIKTHPMGQQLGPLLSSIPQWDDFMSGTNIDPVRDSDWVMISGPALKETSKDIILIRYSAPDDVVDKAMDVVAHKWTEGGAYDAGVPGVHAVLGHADRAPRVFMRPQSGLIAVTPLDVAHKNAVLLHGARMPNPTKTGEAFRMRVLMPQHVIPDLPPTVKEARLWVVPNGDGADTTLELECGTPDEAKDAAAKVQQIIGYWANATLYIVVNVRSITHGLLDGAQVTTEGKVVKVTLPASADQLDALLKLVSHFIADARPDGIGPPPAPAPPPSAAPRAPVPAPPGPAPMPPRPRAP